jgi:hypothetical protein
MTDTPPAEKLLEVEQGLDLMAAILGLDPKVWVRCQGDPVACGMACKRDICPLQANRLQDVGEMLSVLLEEFRWHRAWAEELEAIKIVPPGTLDKVSLRVERSRLLDRLKEAIAANEALTGVQVLRERFVNRMAEIRADIDAIDTKLGGSTGAKA